MKEDHGHAHAPGTPGHHHAPGETHAHDFNFDWVDHHGHSHGDEMTPEELEELSAAVWKVDNVEMTTVGVDVGSSTSHLMFARVHMQRLGEMLSSRFVVVEREVLWRSPILLTPYRPDSTIDAERLEVFVHQAYADAGLAREDVDSGAVILTGEALKRTNSRAIADLFAADSGKFVCASAGHHMEALLAANGSGAVGLSRDRHGAILNVDIGGGTSKLAIIQNGEVIHTAAVAVGGRLVALGEEREVVRLEEEALQAAEDEAKLVGVLADALISLIRLETPTGLAKDLLVTDPLPDDVRPEAISFSGGVAEYIYDREHAGYGDIALPLAKAVRAARSDGRIPLPLLDPGQGIRATVIGASQFTVQVSGNTISVSNEETLPLRNLPVLYPRLDLAQDIVPTEVATAIHNAVRRFDLHDGETPVALGFRWQGDPLYARLRALADGVCRGMAISLEKQLPLVLMLDGDVGKTLGDILKHELDVGGDVISIDGMQLKEFDYVDIGEMIQPTQVVPVVIKSLLFSHPAH
jgi:ethanolamine utilization protein EutA